MKCGHIVEQNPPEIGGDNRSHFFLSLCDLFQCTLPFHQKYLELSGRAIVGFSEENLARFHENKSGCTVRKATKPAIFFLLFYQFFTFHCIFLPCAPTNYSLVLDPVGPNDHELQVRNPFNYEIHLLKNPCDIINPWLQTFEIKKCSKADLKMR